MNYGIPEIGSVLCITTDARVFIDDKMEKSMFWLSEGQIVLILEVRDGNTRKHGLLRVLTHRGIGWIFEDNQDKRII